MMMMMIYSTWMQQYLHIVSGDLEAGESGWKCFAWFLCPRLIPEDVYDLFDLCISFFVNCYMFAFSPVLRPTVSLPVVEGDFLKNKAMRTSFSSGLQLELIL